MIGGKRYTDIEQIYNEGYEDAKINIIEAIKLIGYENIYSEKDLINIIRNTKNENTRTEI